MERCRALSREPGEQVPVSSLSSAVRAPLGRHVRVTNRCLSPQPEVLHMIYLRALQMVYGTRLEHFYMVGAGRGLRRAGREAWLLQGRPL